MSSPSKEEATLYPATSDQKIYLNHHGCVDLPLTLHVTFLRPDMQTGITGFSALLIFICLVVSGVLAESVENMEGTAAASEVRDARQRI